MIRVQIDGYRCTHTISGVRTGKGASGQVIYLAEAEYDRDGHIARVSDIYTAMILNDFLHAAIQKGMENPLGTKVKKNPWNRYGLSKKAQDFAKKYVLSTKIVE